MKRPLRVGVTLALAALLTAATPASSAGQSDPAGPPQERRLTNVLQFFGGALAGLGLHESGHAFFDVLFDAGPRIKRVEFGRIPFFAIVPTASLSPRREFVVSSAGFWMQHASSEWLLTRRPRLRHEHGPVAKGLLAFNVLTSLGYAGVAFARAGPSERDTKGMAHATAIDERGIGAMLLAPALLDAWRYSQPNAAWARWGSRASKIALVLLAVKSTDRNGR